jgi:hypothetical protein
MSDYSDNAPEEESRSEISSNLDNDLSPGKDPIEYALDSSSDESLIDYLISRIKLRIR